ncbi:MAG TPA: DEAD/DEAH box helicase [Epulopiscium sp.]|nr:DEAD/DEAH box helicase [Candidatus Epulonipiscium sp.]
MASPLKQQQLINSLHTGFIDKDNISLEKYRPRLLLNNHKQGKKVLSSIISELENCDEFFFSVAFITYSGVLVLLNTLKELESKGVRGKIVASQYLNFTDPTALRKLLEFENIELRMVVHEDLHSKGYIFRKDDEYNLIVGSSNLTQNALSKNKEWNIKVSSTDKGSLIEETLKEFEQTFHNSVEVNEQWLEQYDLIYRKNKENSERVTKDELGLIIAESTGTEYRVNHDLRPKISPNKMQVKALGGIEKVRERGENKALLISATGTGKTYLAAFDVAKYKPKKMLFIAHREQILNQSIESFKNVLGSDISVGKIGGGYRDLDCQFTFSTVQTMSKDDILAELEPDTFDYIVIDESHRAGAETYQKIMSHYKPEFLLGMTATPERSDDHNICKDFDYNIAYEIRLQQAMEEEMLAPFHYFGITELTVDGHIIDEESEFKYLVSEERVRNIIEKVRFYGHDGDICKGLIFCSRNEEALELSNAFNRHGYKTIALSGGNTQEEREVAVNRLESEEEDHLDYIFTVDIFNEGIDVPHVNQVIMLRPTKSAIIFVQQLGRGLRKARNKEFVVVLDFIGNYKTNFMIPVALSDDRSFNKDTVRRYVAEGSRVIPGCTTINFDAIAKKRIYESIDQANFNSVAFIKESYKNLKFRLGKIPALMDFENHDSLDLARMFENNSIGSYYRYLEKYEDEYTIRLTDLEAQYIEFISKKLAIGKRPHELIVIEGILKGETKLMTYMKERLEMEFGIACLDKTITNVANVLTNKFATGVSKKTYKECVFIAYDGADYRVNSNFQRLLKNNSFASMIEELIDFGLYRNKKYYGEIYKKTSFQLYQKYSYEDVCRLLEWEKNVVSLNIGGYKYDEKTKTYPVFINYHKDDSINETIKYEDEFLTSSKLKAISKAKRTLQSSDIITAYNAETLGVSMDLFVRKNKDDKGSKEFYYLGRIKTTGEPKEVFRESSGDNVVELMYQLDTPVREDLYDYITEV